MFRPADLLDLAQTEHERLFVHCEYAWEALPKIKDYLAENCGNQRRHQEEGRVFIGDNVSIGEGTVVEEGAMIKGPTVIGRNCQIRHNAYIRGGVIIGDNCVVGNACELKTSILFNNCAVPHFNYVGDSILGFKAHLGAGVKVSNIKLVPGSVSVKYKEEIHDTGLRKFGAIFGDYSEAGCNTVLNPGSVLGRYSVIYPNTNWRGVLGPNQIAKNKAPQEIAERRPLDS